MPFTGIDFNQFLTNAKSSVSAFDYVKPINWFSYEQGVFPDSLKGNSYTIKLETFDAHDEVEHWSVLSTSVEFLLNGLHDGYLAKIDDCIEAIRQISTNVSEGSSNNQIQLQNIENQKDFSVQYIGELVALSFSVTWILDNRTSTEIS